MEIGFDNTLINNSGTIQSLLVSDKTCVFNSLLDQKLSGPYNPDRVPAFEYDTDAAAYFTAVEAAGGSFDLTAVDATYTDTYVKEAHNNFYAGIKNDGLWDKLTEFYFLVGKTFDGITVKGKGTGSLTNNNFVSGDYLPTGTGAGLSGDGSTKWLYSTNVPNLSSFNLGTYSTQKGTGTFRMEMGWRASNNKYNVVKRNDVEEAGVTFAGIGQRKVLSSPVCYTIGSYDNGSLKLYINGINQGSPISGSATPLIGGEKLGIMAAAFNNFGGTPDFTVGNDFIDATLTFAHIGTGLTDTDASNLSNRVNKLMFDLGCNTYYDAGTLTALDSDAANYVQAVFDAGGDFE